MKIVRLASSRKFNKSLSITIQDSLRSRITSPMRFSLSMAQLQRVLTNYALINKTTGLQFRQ